MLRFARRAVAVLSVALASAVPALAAGASAGAAGGVETSGSFDGAGTSCGHEGVATAFVLGHAGGPVVEGVTVTGISSDCAGHRLRVVVEGVPGYAVARSPRTDVLLERAVPADAVSGVTIRLGPAVERAGRTEAA